MSQIKYEPGEEPLEIKAKLTKLFDMLDEAFPDRLILWADWDHRAWDRLAGELVKELGYERGLYFLNAYGYYVDMTVPPDEFKRFCKCEGSIVTVLKHARSGFIRCDADGVDYYFRINDFEKKVKHLEIGQRVRFVLDRRDNPKTGERALCAVKVEYIENS